MRRAPMTNEDRAKNVRQLTQQSIQFALAGKWEDALFANEELLRLTQRNSETLNRMGKALSELGRISEAKKAYNESLKIDPENTIARKNLDRLSLLSDKERDATTSTEKFDTRLFIEEIGKTGITQLVNLSSAQVIARLTPGEQAYLFIDGHAIFVKNGRGEILGQLEPVLANRLIAFILGGNLYAAAVTEVNGTNVRLIIRETFQHPSQLSKVSFPATGPGAIRTDTRDLFARDSEEEDDDDDDDEETIEEEDDDETLDTAEEIDEVGGTE